MEATVGSLIDAVANVQKELEEKAIGVFNQLFDFAPDEEERTFEDIYHHLSEVFPHSNLSIDDKISVIEHLLVYSVTETDLQQRECLLTYITQELNQSAQEFLVRRIQDITRRNENKNEKGFSKPSNATSDHMNGNPSDASDRIAQLELELQQLRIKHEQELKDLKKSLILKEQKVDEEECLLLQKDSQLFQLQQQLEESHQQLQHFQEIEEKYQTLQQQFLQTQDEFEVMKEQILKSEKLEDEYQRLRDRYEELKVVKQQLMTETTTHQITYEKLIIVEKELEELRKLPSLVEKYRQELTEQTIIVNDLRYELQQKMKTMEELQQKLQSLQGHHSLLLQEKQSLSSELLTTAEELRSSYQGIGIGQGISELNPVLMQELMKLREENQQLKQTIQQTAIEELERLQKAVADTTAMNQSLVEKWNDTKATLANEQQENQRLTQALLEAQLQITLLINQIDTLKADHLTAIEQLQKDHHEAQEQLTLSFNQQITELQSQHDAQIQELLTTHAETITQRDEAHRLAQESWQEQMNQRYSELEEEMNKRRKVERLRKLADSECTRLKFQLAALQSTGGGGNGSEGSMAELQIAAKELKTMQESLDAAQQEIHTLKSLLENATTMATTATTTTASTGNGNSGKTTTATGGGVPSSLAPATRLPMSKPVITTSRSTHASNYLDHSEVTDKRIEQLEREKRDILSRSLEDNKEKMELSQRLLVLDKENVQLKSEVRKLTLDKGRLERKLLKEGGESLSNPLEGEKENLVN